MRHKELGGLGIPQRSVTHILKQYLEYWGLVKKEEGKFGRWYWYEEIREYRSKAHFEVFMDHTRELATALTVLLQYDYTLPPQEPGYTLEGIREIIDKQDFRYRLPFAEEHLRTGYPEIYGQMLELRRLKREKDAMKGPLVNKIEEEVKDALREVEPDESRWDLFKIENAVNSVLYDAYEINLRHLVRIDETSKSQTSKSVDFQGLLDGQNSYQHDEPKEDSVRISFAEKIDEFHRLREKEESVYREFARNAAILLIKIKTEPLEGTCRLCPRVIIRDDKDSRNGERGRTSKSR